MLSKTNVNNKTKTADTHSGRLTRDGRFGSMGTRSDKFANMTASNFTRTADKWEAAQSTFAQICHWDTHTHR